MVSLYTGQETISTNFSQVLTPGPHTPQQCIDECHTTANNAAVTHVHIGVNMSCTFKI
jgi:hypothetical protein